MCVLGQNLGQICERIPRPVGALASLVLIIPVCCEECQVPLQAICLLGECLTGNGATGCQVSLGFSHTLAHGQCVALQGQRACCAPLSCAAVSWCSCSGAAALPIGADRLAKYD